MDYKDMFYIIVGGPVILFLLIIIVLDILDAREYKKCLLFIRRIETKLHCDKILSVDLMSFNRGDTRPNIVKIVYFSNRKEYLGRQSFMKKFKYLV